MSNKTYLLCTIKKVLSFLSSLNCDWIIQWFETKKLLFDLTFFVCQLKGCTFSRNLDGEIGEKKLFKLFTIFDVNLAATATCNLRIYSWGNNRYCIELDLMNFLRVSKIFLNFRFSKNIASAESFGLFWRDDKWNKVGRSKIFLGAHFTAKKKEKNAVTRGNEGAENLLRHRSNKLDSFLVLIRN